MSGEAFPAARLGLPRLHLRRIDSTNRRARELAVAGAPHGTLVTAAVQTAGRGRQGRTWTAPAGRALLCSVVVRDFDRLLPLVAGAAVADVADAADAAGRRAQIKWPNDVLLAGTKVAGILVEGRSGEGWAVLGMGINVAVRSSDLPPELRDRAGGLGLAPQDVEPTLQRLLGALERRMGQPSAAVLETVRERDALLGRRVRWSGGEGRGAGIDDAGRLIVQVADGSRHTLEAGEVHLVS